MSCTHQSAKITVVMSWNQERFPLNVFGQQTSLGIYTQICLCFPVTDESSYSLIPKRLAHGLERLSASFPWVAGQVVNEEGTFSITSLAKIPRLVVKDLRGQISVPSMNDLHEANFPIGMLNEQVIALQTTLPDSADESKSKPVFEVQATFIKGGLILTFVGQHQAMDMTGQEQVMTLLSKACHDQSFTEEEISSCNMRHADIFPLLDDSWEPGTELDHQILKPQKHHTAPNGSTSESSPQTQSLWANISLSKQSLTDLKTSASESLPASATFVSTDDAVTALFWQSITRARSERLDPQHKTQLARAVDTRALLDISPKYPGTVQQMTYNSSTVEKLTNEPLGVVSAQLRSTLDPETSNLSYKTRALITFLSRAPDKSITDVTASLNLTTDVMLSSWAALNSYELDFNLELGKPEGVRRPLFAPVESLGYLLPRTPDGEITVAMCLRSDDLERLKSDKDFSKYARFDG